jgi:hypothetical protein
LHDRALWEVTINRIHRLALRRPDHIITPSEVMRKLSVPQRRHLNTATVRDCMRILVKLGYGLPVKPKGYSKVSLHHQDLIRPNSVIGFRAYRATKEAYPYSWHGCELLPQGGRPGAGSAFPTDWHC